MQETMQFFKEGFETAWRRTEELKDTVLKVPEGTKLVRLATNNEQWGPSGTQMRQISDLTFNYTEYPNIMQSLWERLNENGNDWRNIYKALLVLDYLIKNGSDKVVNDARQNSYQIKILQRMQHIDEEGQDRGLSVRERARHISDLLHDTERLREERKKSKQNRDKYNTSLGSETASFNTGWNRRSSRNDEFESRHSSRNDEFESNSSGFRRQSGGHDYSDSDEGRDEPVEDNYSRKKPETPRSTGQRTTFVEASKDEWAEWESPPTASWPSNPQPLSPRGVQTLYPPTTSPTIGGPTISNPFDSSFGPSLGPSVGPSLGNNLGPSLGNNLGPSLGPSVGPSLGNSLGPSLGNSLGPSLGSPSIYNYGPSLGEYGGGANQHGGTNSSTPGLNLSEVRNTNPASISNPSLEPKTSDPWEAHKHLFNLTAINEKPKQTATGPTRTLSSTVGNTTLFGTAPPPTAYTQGGPQYMTGAVTYPPTNVYPVTPGYPVGVYPVGGYPAGGY